MKKIAVRLLIALVLVLMLAVLAAGFFLDGAIKTGVETAGPKIAKVPVTLQSVNLSLFSGSGKLTGLVVGNPEGCRAPSAIDIGALNLALKPGSLLADKLVVKTFELRAPEIDFETDLRGNNLSKILANLNETSGGAKDESAQPKSAAKKLEVDDLLITGGKLHVSINALGQQQSATVALPEIHLTGLGLGPEGITAAQLAKVVLQAIETNAVQAAGASVADLQKQGALFIQKDVGKTASNNLGTATKSLGDLFKKK